MTEKQHDLLERFVVELMRAGETENASHMMTMQIEYKWSEELGPPLPDNVVDISGHSVRV